jgi:hypothetical protein
MADFWADRYWNGKFFNSRYFSGGVESLFANISAGGSVEATLSVAGGQAVAPATTSGRRLIIPYRKKQDEAPAKPQARASTGGDAEATSDAAFAAIADRVDAALDALPGARAIDAMVAGNAAQAALDAAMAAIEQARDEDEDTVLMLLLAA